MYRSKFVFSLAFVFLLLWGFQQTAIAQFARVDRIIRQFEEQVVPGVSLTPDLSSTDFFLPDSIVNHLVKSIEWEVQKLELQHKFLKDAKDRLEAIYQAQESERLNLRLELFELGVIDESSLQLRVQQNRENEIRLAGLQAQLAALKEAIDSQSSQATQQLDIDRKIIAEEIENYHQLINSLKEELGQKEKMYEQGVMSKDEIWSIRRNLETQLMQRRIAELKMAQVMQAPPLTPEQNQQLTTVTAQIAKFESESMANALNPDKIAEIYSRLLLDKKLFREQEKWMQKLSALEERLVEVEMELEYLNTILAQYREAVAKSKKLFDSKNKDSNPGNNDE